MNLQIKWTEIYKDMSWNKKMSVNFGRKKRVFFFENITAYFGMFENFDLKLILVWTCIVTCTSEQKIIYDRNLV